MTNATNLSKQELIQIGPDPENQNRLTLYFIRVEAYFPPLPDHAVAIHQYIFLPEETVSEETSQGPTISDSLCQFDIELNLTLSRPKHGCGDPRYTLGHA